MPSSYTPILGFVLPTTGELTNQWGPIVNNQLTQLVEDAIANYSTADLTSSDWTLTTTAGGASNQARSALLIATGTPGTTRSIIAPKLSKTYVVMNNTDSTVYIKGGPTSPTTGVFVFAGQSALVAWDTTVSDFIKVAGGSGGATGGGTDQVFFNNDQNVTTNYTIPTGKNSGTFGPVTVNSGAAVTVPTGSVWTVV